ncbi:siderophore-interacting protein [Nonomuraea sp. NN258]|uniref:siderophore-interacting protein n=1 Tax=Nonomuraea antri TaxID=2730852 RepID=UPI001569EBCA|nr:siderophore-interacting protein [Nonomuraea antri]NRQ30947.1 siderophore-interacting protein [Nonomuraea antri]
MTTTRTTRTSRVHTGRVRHAEWITPGMRRVVFGGPGLRDFPQGELTDRYVKLLFPAPGVTYPEPFDLAAVRRDLPREQWPRMRTYTVRRWDETARELTLDFVHHGDRGLAGPWAAAAVPGDQLSFLGPGGGYAPDPLADWHLMAGDESALPAIAASLEALPESATALVLVEVSGPREEQRLESRARVRVTWAHRDADEPAGGLAALLAGAEFPPGRVHAFVHGEANLVKELRRHLLVERNLSRDRLSISGYWRRGLNEDGWQASKSEWNQRTEHEHETLSTRSTSAGVEL